MYRRLVIISLVILAAMCGLTWLGYHSIRMQAEGMRGSRMGRFAAAAERIRQDVKHKLDQFIKDEQERPYTDYQYYYVPETAQENGRQEPLLRSPIGNRLERGLAYGNFQIEPDGTVTTPYYRGETPPRGTADIYSPVAAYIENIKTNLLPVLEGRRRAFYASGGGLLSVEEGKAGSEGVTPSDDYEKTAAMQRLPRGGGRGKDYLIESLQRQSGKARVLTQKRSVVASNVAQVGAPAEEFSLGQDARTRRMDKVETPLTAAGSAAGPDAAAVQSEPVKEVAGGRHDLDHAERPPDSETVQIRIEPFVPLVVEGGEDSIFPGQVFMLRHVQIEARHFLQGFRLNEEELAILVRDSARRFVRAGVDFELSQVETEKAAFAAVLDFGFGRIVLNLFEIDPTWIARQTGRLRNWYFAITTVVFAVVLLGLAGLWRSMRAQARLAQRKDDFISAVSHELRTPITSIRMYAEMLENAWVRSPEKVRRYYRNIRQETERLSRLIENVLDFSRIQKGRKKYSFMTGDISECVRNVAGIMQPYAARKGFSIRTECTGPHQVKYDRDAVSQIVVNLLDNAIKYAAEADDKTVIVRTRAEGAMVFIEVEDRGPGVAQRQRKKIFEEFYRTGSEATRRTAGTGLGLALVKKFAEAHGGFAEVAGAEPAGAVFRVGLAGCVDVKNGVRNLFAAKKFPDPFFSSRFRRPGGP